MSQTKIALALLLASLSFACSDKGETPPVDESGDGEVVDAPTAEATDVVDDVVDSVGDTVDGAVEGATAGAIEAAKAQADGLIEKIKSYVGEDKIDLAKQTFDQLLALKDQLPASYQEKIEQVRKLVEGSGVIDQAKKLGEGLGIGGGN